MESVDIDTVAESEVLWLVSVLLHADRATIIEAAPISVLNVFMISLDSFDLTLVYYPRFYKKELCH
jgi:hypothetical protein